MSERKDKKPHRKGGHKKFETTKLNKIASLGLQAARSKLPFGKKGKFFNNQGSVLQIAHKAQAPKKERKEVKLREPNVLARLIIINHVKKESLDGFIQQAAAKLIKDHATIKQAALTEEQASNLLKAVHKLLTDFISNKEDKKAEFFKDLVSGLITLGLTIEEINQLQKVAGQKKPESLTHYMIRKNKGRHLQVLLNKDLEINPDYISNAYRNNRIRIVEKFLEKNGEVDATEAFLEYLKKPKINSKKSKRVDWITLYKLASIGIEDVTKYLPDNSVEYQKTQVKFPLQLLAFLVRYSQHVSNPTKEGAGRANRLYNKYLAKWDKKDNDSTPAKKTIACLTPYSESKSNNRDIAADLIERLNEVKDSKNPNDVVDVIRQFFVEITTKGFEGEIVLFAKNKTDVKYHLTSTEKARFINPEGTFMAIVLASLRRSLELTGDKILAQAKGSSGAQPTSSLKDSNEGDNNNNNEEYDQESVQGNGGLVW